MKCVVTNWEYVDFLCRRVAEQVMEDYFDPDVIVALAKGGWFAGRIMCDILGIDELVSVRVEHYSGLDEVEVNVRQLPSETDLKGKRILIVDDIANTGMSIRAARDRIEELGVEEVKTATLLLLNTSKYIPDYFGECLEEWVWVIFPWNFVEDMVSLIRKVMDSERRDIWTEWDIKRELQRRFGLDPIQLEISQPGRFSEVLRIMERRGIIDRYEDGEKVYWCFRKVYE